MGFSGLTIGQYLPGGSILHRLDPRTKIIGVTGLVVMLFFVPSFAGLGGFAALVLALFAVARISPAYALRGIRPLIVLLVFTALLNTFFAPVADGHVLFRFGPLMATMEGLRTGLFVAARLILLVVVTSLMTFTTSPVELTDGLERLLRPFQRLGVPGHELAMMTTIALRFIPTLLEETDKIMKAQMARGAEFDRGGVLARARAFVPVLVPLMVSAFRRSEDLALAMEARCYRGGAGRTRMNELRWQAADVVAFLVMGAAAAAVVWVRR
ncbi:MAG: energy-coupling factor transporter transmembrane component T [Armatimonadota bacterium]|nr:energy-coupling factor transporter transmembrane component T [Armatimonadota bacterium]